MVHFSETIVDESASFYGSSWVEFDKEMMKSGRYERSADLEFTTSEPEGLLLWHGQELPPKFGSDSDYLSLACKQSVFYSVFIWQVFNILRQSDVMSLTFLMRFFQLLK